MRGPRLVPWLLAVGLLLITFAGTWQVLEQEGREWEGELLKPDSVPFEPGSTLVDRIRATWEPGDRLRGALLIAGLALCAAGAWRAWRVEGLPVGSVRRVALTLAIVGTACVALGLFRARTHPRDWWSGTYVSVDRPAGQIGNTHADGTSAPAGTVPLLAIGPVLLGVGALLGLLSLLYAPRAPLRPRAPAHTP